MGSTSEPSMHPVSSPFDMGVGKGPVRRECRVANAEIARYAIMEGCNPQGAKIWLVAFSRGGRAIRMSFPHARYGGEEPALAVAIACRDAALASLKPTTNREIRTIVRRNRTEGVPGVYFQKAMGYRGASWLAVITLPNGRSRRRYFAVSRYGETEARRLAEEARERLLDEVDDIDAAALRSGEAKIIEQHLPAQPPSSAPYPKTVVRETGRRGEGWRTSVVLGNRLLHQHYTDMDFGSEVAAMNVALAWRTAVTALAETPASSEPAAGVGLMPVLSRRRLSGVSAPEGVYFNPAVPGRSAVWQARTVLPSGRCAVRSFSVSRHGEDEARRLAEAERARMRTAEAENLVGPKKNR